MVKEVARADFGSGKKWREAFVEAAGVLNADWGLIDATWGFGMAGVARDGMHTKLRAGEGIEEQPRRCSASATVKAPCCASGWVLSGQGVEISNRPECSCLVAAVRSSLLALLRRLEAPERGLGGAALRQVVHGWRGSAPLGGTRPLGGLVRLAGRPLALPAAAVAGSGGAAGKAAAAAAAGAVLAAGGGAGGGAQVAAAGSRWGREGEVREHTGK